METKASKGAEFLKIYGITLIIAFILTTAVKHRLSSNTIFESVKPELTAPAPPIADVDDLLPFKNLKKIFANLSF